MNIFVDFLIAWKNELIGSLAIALGVFFRKQISSFFKYLFYNQVEEDITNVSHEVIRVEEETKLLNDDILDRLDEIQETLSILGPLKDGTRSMLFASLKARCKEAVDQGWVDIEEYALIKSDYDIYKRLDGNGYMDAWMEQIELLQKK